MDTAGSKLSGRQPLFIIAALSSSVFAQHSPLQSQFCSPRDISKEFLQYL